MSIRYRGYRIEKKDSRWAIFSIMTDEYVTSVDSVEEAKEVIDYWQEAP
jgi:predicted metal-dependent hydrolase